MKKEPLNQKVRIHVIVTVAQYNALAAKAKASGDTVSTIIRQTIAKGLSK